MENVKKTAASTASKVGEAAQGTLQTGAAIGGLAMHSAEQRRQEMMRDWDKERAISEKNTAHGRKEAAKSALEHHFEAKEQALAAAHMREDSGIRTAEENISSAASAVSGAVSSAGRTVSGAVSSASGAVSGALAGARDTAKDTFTAASDVGKLAAEATLEQKAAAQESFYKGRATQETLTPHARKEAAKNALEAHIERKEHAQEKARLEEDLGLGDRLGQAKESIVETAGAVKEKVSETLPKVAESASQAASTAADYAKSGASTAADYARVGASRAGEVIIPYLQAAKANVSGAAAAAAHLALEKKHEVQEGWARSKVEDERATAHDRKEAAKAALEHHLQAQSHAAQTSTPFGDMISWLWRFLIAVLSSVASAAYHLPSNIYSSLTGAATVATSTASAATHKALEAKETMQERVAQTQAVSEALPPKQRMESAKAALEHHEAARGHAAAKEFKKREAGLDTVGEKISEAFETAKEQTSTFTTNVTGTVKGTFQSVGQKTHELQESYYKNQAIAEDKAPADRMDAAKKALDHHAAAAKTS